MTVASLILAATLLGASDLDEFKIKREAVFEFVQKPQVTRLGDRVTIAFETKGSCDVTVAVEDAKGRIVRHLASGVLGPNAPAPFQKNAKQQAIVWDGKNDQGEYIDDAERMTIRVSLGLQARFERTLYWSPVRRSGLGVPLLCATREGVYVYDGMGMDHLRLFGHDGQYRRTLYPFPAGKLHEVKGLDWHEYVQGGRWPLKRSVLMQTLLTSGDNAGQEPGDVHAAMEGNAATAMAVSNGRIALAKQRLNRLATDGTTGGLPLEGPRVTDYIALNPNSPFYGPPKEEIFPWSTAISPDGQWVYFAGYAHRVGDARLLVDYNCLHGVTRTKYSEQREWKVFAGKMTAVAGRANNMADCGRDNAHFACATWVACDAKGRVYVADYLNDRIQVFADDGAWLKTIATEKPAKIQVHPETGDLYVFSYVVHNPTFTRESIKSFKHTLTHFGPFEQPRVIESYALPMSPYNYNQGLSQIRRGAAHCVELDFWADPPTLWLATAKVPQSNDWDAWNIRTFVLKDGQVVPKTVFGDEVEKVLARRKSLNLIPQVQYLHVNPATGRLYLAEPDAGQAFSQLVEIDPETGSAKVVDLPFETIDLAFDLSGTIYLRTVDVVVRYDPRTWREIPWDYGSEIPNVGASTDRKTAPVISGLVVPSRSTNQGHQGGMSMSAKGCLAISCVNYEQPAGRLALSPFIYGPKKYVPQMYPGRLGRETVHVFDPHGKVMHEDAVPGLGRTDGVWIDAADHLYVMTVGHRVLDGERYFNNRTSTLVKFKSKTARVLSSSQRQDTVPITLPRDRVPKRPPDLYGMGDIWAEGAEWFYGGVGFAGKNLDGDAEMGCCCWHATFGLDLFARSFAPEVDQFRVAVLDSNGNLIMRIGQYGNVDDGRPLVKEGGPSAARTIGGDEVGLFHACYVATHTDKRLFIADAGNNRLLSVRLGYAATERVDLKYVEEGQHRPRQG